MKYRFLKINGKLIWGENTVTKEMLIMVKNRQYDTIIDLEDGTYYDADENNWLQIEGSNG